MELPKLLIADSCEEFRQALADTLGSQFHIRTCHAGSQVLLQMAAFRPDILVIDLVLPELDGITVLHRAQQAGLTPKVLAFVPVQSDYIVNALQNLDVAYVMMKPCDLQAVSCRISDLYADLRSGIGAQPDLSAYVTTVLLSLSLGANRDGFRYLQAAIPLYAADPHQAITKELYTAVGVRFGKPAKLVERSIRSVIEDAWRRGDPALWRAYFPGAPGGVLPRPTNSVFIAALAAAVTTRMEQKSG